MSIAIGRITFALRRSAMCRTESNLLMPNNERPMNRAREPPSTTKTRIIAYNRGRLTSL
jgi:hypothetical protein